MSQQVGSPALVLAAWLVAGLLSLAGALTYAELGAMLPHAGGEYLYVRTAYGDAAGFSERLDAVRRRFGWHRRTGRGLRDLSLRRRADAGRVGAADIPPARPRNTLAARQAGSRSRSGDPAVRRHQLRRRCLWRTYAVRADRGQGARHCDHRRRGVSVLRQRFGGALPDAGVRAALDRPTGFRRGHAFGVVGLRWMGLHADGGGRGEGPRTQYSASVDHRRSGRAGALRAGQPGILLGAAVRRDPHRQFELASRRAPGGGQSGARHSWDRAARPSSRSCS